MPPKMNALAHFALHADDTERAKAFYSSVFDWSFNAWGPPDFFHIQGPGIQAALQKRRDVTPGKRVNGFECTLAVEDIDATIAAVKAAGGKILGDKATIPTVGTLVFFEDSEGNVVGAMQYEPDTLASMP